MLGYACASIEGEVLPMRNMVKSIPVDQWLTLLWPTVQHTSHVVSISQRTPFYCGCTRIGRIPWYGILYLTGKVVAVCNGLYFYFMVPT